MLRYSVVLMPEEGGYVVRVPALPGCITQGESVADALDAARDLIPLWIASLADAGEDIPVEEGSALFCVLDVAAPQETAMPQQAASAAPPG